MTIHAVLFDLDDTLFDHHHCSRCALEAVQASHECFGRMALDELERTHRRFLEELHGEVMIGRVPIDDARRERFRRLFAAAGHEADAALVNATAGAYRDAYIAARRAIDGALALLPLVRTRARVGVVSNNLLEEQQQKLQDCGLEPFVDALVVSEELGISKPDPQIFRVALERLDCTADEAVMIGDSWSADVMGARAAGIRGIWFNRHGLPQPGGHERVEELRTLEPPADVVKVIFGADWR